MFTIVDLNRSRHLQGEKLPPVFWWHRANLVVFKLLSVFQEPAGVVLPFEARPKGVEWEMGWLKSLQSRVRYNFEKDSGKTSVKMNHYLAFPRAITVRFCKMVDAESRSIQSDQPCPLTRHGSTWISQCGETDPVWESNFERNTQKIGAKIHAKRQKMRWGAGGVRAVQELSEYIQKVRCASCAHAHTHRLTVWASKAVRKGLHPGRKNIQI